MHLLERKREEPGTSEKDNGALDISNLNLKLTISYILLFMDVKFFYVLGLLNIYYKYNIEYFKSSDLTPL